VRWLLRSLGLADATAAERRATFWTAAMFGLALASTFVLRPLRDQFGVDRGVARLPYLYSLTLVVTTVFVPAFWWLANRMPSRRFVPAALHASAAMMLLLFFALTAVGSYDWQARGARWVGEAFWGFFSAFNVAVPTLVWIHAVEHFRREQGLRLFGIIGVGGTAGAVLGSLLAQQVSSMALPPSSAALASLVLLESTFLCYLGSRRACSRMPVVATAAAAPDARVSRSGMLAGLRLLFADRHLLAIAGYMLLLGMVATAFAVAQTELVGEQVASPRAQHGWLAHTELLSQSLVLGLQLFCTGRLLRRLPAALFLSLMPLLSTLGLGVLWLWPTVATVAVVQILRRGAQFSLEKPSREVLYTPLDLETKHKVKFLLDTFALRAGDLIGACFQVYVLRKADIGATGILIATVTLAGLWAAIGIGLGRRGGRRAAVQAVG
jgi:ATP:ADP antiporter, AAA family